MFENLPEIICKIALYLDYDQQLTLATTCKAYYNVIFYYTLFHDLNFNHEDYEDMSLFERFRSKELNGKQVKRLTIRSCNLERDMIEKLPLVFPNVQELIDKTEEHDHYQHWSKPTGELDNLYSWKDTLQKLYMDGDYSHLTHLLEKENMVPSCLTYLSISPFKDFHAGTETHANLSLCLKNTLSLKHLRLYQCTVDLKFLEDMHAAIPQLESLSLSDLMITTTNESLPSPMKPATQLTSFEVSGDAIFIDENMVFLDYVIQKYPYLKKLVFCGIRNKHFFCGRFYQYRKDVSPEVSEDDAEIEFKKTRKTYKKDGAKRFLSHLSPSIKDLTIDVCLFDNMQEAFEISNIQPEHVVFHQHTRHVAFLLHRNVEPHIKCAFRSSKHFTFFNNWTRLTSLKLVTIDDMNRFFGPVYSDTLTSLELTLFPTDYYSDGVFIDRVLLSFPSLTHLKMESDNFMHLSKKYKKAKKANKTIVYPNLRSLTLTMGMFAIPLVEFLVTALPNLKELVWIARGLYKNWDFQRIFNIPMFTVDFTGLNLDRFHLCVQFQHPEEDFRIYPREEEEYKEFMETENKVFLETRNGEDFKKYTYIADESGRCVSFSKAEHLDEEKIKKMPGARIKYNNKGFQNEKKTRILEYKYSDH